MCRYLRLQPLLRIWRLLTVLFRTLQDQDFAQVRWRRRSMIFTHSYRSSCRTRLGSKIASKRLLRQWPPRLPRLPILNKLLGALWLASLPWKRMQLLVPVALIQQDLGICLDRVPAPLFKLAPLGGQTSLVFLLRCCNTFSLKPTGSMCDGRPLASPFFRRLAGRGAFFCGFPFRWILHFVFYLIRGVALHESPSCSREDPLDECGRPCDPLSCLLFSALWLRCNQSLLVQETRSAKDLDLTCSTAILFCDATCHQVGPMSLDWPVDPHGRFHSSRSSLPPDVPSGVRQGAFPVSILPFETGCPSYTISDITPYHRVGWMWPLPSRRLEMYYLEHQGPGGISFLQTKEQRIQTQISQKTLGQQHYLSPGSARKGRISSSLSRCWLRDFDSLVPCHLTMRMREDRLGTFCPKKLLFHMQLLVRAVIIL